MFLNYLDTNSPEINIASSKNYQKLCQDTIKSGRLGLISMTQKDNQFHVNSKKKSITKKKSVLSWNFVLSDLSDKIELWLLQENSLKQFLDKDLLTQCHILSKKSSITVNVLNQFYIWLLKVVIQLVLLMNLVKN